MLKPPKFWTEIYDGVKNSCTNLSKRDAQCNNTCKNEFNCQQDVEDCDAVKKSCKLFIRTHPVFGSLSIKKLCNNAAICSRLPIEGTLDG